MSVHKRQIGTRHVGAHMYSACISHEICRSVNALLVKQRWEVKSEADCGPYMLSAPPRPSCDHKALTLNSFQDAYTYINTSIIPRRRDGTGTWNSSSCKTRTHIQYRCYWCTGDRRSQGISRHGIDMFPQNVPFPTSGGLMWYFPDCHNKMVVFV